MEEHRLRPMKDGYNEKLFNQIYKETKPLRKKLASEIDSRRFGVDYYEVLSWFDIKLIHAFSRYEKKYDENVLRGFIIRSLQMFKYRILRMAYSQKFEMYQKTQDIDEIGGIENLSQKETENNPLLDVAFDFLKSHLSSEAFTLLQLEIHPPLYILKKIDNPKRIPDNLIIEFFDLGENAAAYLNKLRKEIKEGVKSATQYFADKPKLVITTN